MVLLVVVESIGGIAEWLDPALGFGAILTVAFIELE